MFYAFIISSLAGLSTFLGAFLLFLKKINSDKLLGFSLSFSAGIMLSICLFDLIPSSITGLNKNFYILFTILLLFLFFIFGISLSFFINMYLPNENNLYKIGIFSMIVIIIHNVPEGIATFLTSYNDFNLGIKLGLAIAFHNIPEGISISVPIYFSSHKKSKAFLYTFISGFSELIGSFIAYLFLINYDVTIFLYILYSFIAGIMFYLSLFELLPNSFMYYKKCKSILCFICGFIFMLFFHFFTK